MTSDAHVVRPRRDRVGEIVRRLPQVIIAIVSIAATLGFNAVFGDWAFLVPATAGAVGASVIAELLRTLNERRGPDDRAASRVGAAESLLLSAVGFVVIGIVVTQGVPGADAVRDFFGGLTGGWSTVLTSVTPASMTSELSVLPFTVAWLGVAVGSTLLRVSSIPGLAALGPLAALVVASLVSLERRGIAIVQGLVVLLGALAIAVLQQSRRDLDGRRRSGSTTYRATQASSSPPSRRRGGPGLVSAVAIGAVVAIAAPLLGPRLPWADAETRFDLRDYLEPPFDPLAQPSPLVQIKAALQEQYADTAVLTVRSDTQLDRFALATLDAYDGEVWAVAGEERAEQRFRQVDAAFPGPVGATLDRHAEVTAAVEVRAVEEIAGGEFASVWLPTPGWPRSVTSDADLDLRFNDLTGTTALVPDGPSAGLEYEVTAAIAPAIESIDLRAATVTRDEPVDLAVPQLRDFAADVLEGADVGWEQVEAIRVALVDGGFYDSRVGTPGGRPGHSLGRLAEVVNDPGRVVGFEEQYAAVAALLLRGVGLPSRVVVGYLVEDPAQRWDDGRLDVFADDISAWIEVRFDEYGWLPFDVTPPRDRLPEDITVGQTERRVATPNPPPDPPPPPPPAGFEGAEPPELEERRVQGTIVIETWTTARVVAAAVGGTSLLLVAAIGTILLLKRRRTNRRRHAPTPSLRVAGAWCEVVDRWSEIGAQPVSSATRTEFARGLIAERLVPDDDADELLALAAAADVASYDPRPPSDDLADDAWVLADELTDHLESGQPVVGRIRRSIDPRPLLRRDPLAALSTASASTDDDSIRDARGRDERDLSEMSHA